MLFARAPPQQPIQVAQLPLHLQMAAHILETSFHSFRDVSIVRYTFADRPSWLSQARRSCTYSSLTLGACLSLVSAAHTCLDWE